MDGRRSSVKEFIGLQMAGKDWHTDVQCTHLIRVHCEGVAIVRSAFRKLVDPFAWFYWITKKGKGRIKTRFDYRGPAFESQAWLSGKQMTFIVEMHRVSWTVVSSALLNPGFNRLGGLSLPFNWTSSSNFSSKFEPFFIRQILIALWGEPTTSLPPPEAWTQLDLPTSRQWQVAGV